MDKQTEQLLRDFIAWCKRREVPSGSELAILRDRAADLLPTEQVNPLDRYRFHDEKHA